MSDESPRGEVNLLGIYGHSAYNSLPADKATFDVNQVPMMFFDYTPTKKGVIMLGVMVDGDFLKDFSDHGEMGVHTNVDPALLEKAQVKRRAQDFWIPQKNRTPGNHEIKLLAGYTEEYKDFLFRTKTRTVWNTTRTCTLTLTGTKRSGD